MTGFKIAYTEKVTDKVGVERIYGYTIDGLKIWLNMLEVKRKYEEMQIDNIKVVS